VTHGIESKPLNLHYLNPLGKLELRPKRNGSEISRHDVFRIRIAGITLVAITTVVSKGRVSILSNTFLEL
jgi:hypothetical protein